MNAILHDKVDVGKAVNVKVISIQDAAQGYKDFDIGEASKTELSLLTP
jgi:glutathione-independent formaldehyde dehydrogenase